MVRQTVGILVISLGLVIAGCGTPRKTITGSEAIQRTDSHLTDAVKAAPSGIQLIRENAEATAGSGCTKPLAGSDFTGQVQAEVTYEAKDVPPDAAHRYLDALGRLWEKRGTVDRMPDRVGVYIDGYGLYAVYHPEARDMTVGGNSPCIWANGTPGPEDNL